MAGQNHRALGQASVTDSPEGQRVSVGRRRPGYWVGKSSP